MQSRLLFIYLFFYTCPSTGHYKDCYRSSHPTGGDDNHGDLEAHSNEGETDYDESTGNYPHTVAETEQEYSTHTPLYQRLYRWFTKSFLQNITSSFQCGCALLKRGDFRTFLTRYMSLLICLVELSIPHMYIFFPPAFYIYAP